MLSMLSLLLLLLLGSLVGEQGQAQDILDWIADSHFFFFFSVHIQTVTSVCLIFLLICSLLIGSKGLDSSTYGGGLDRCSSLWLS